jgi:hypothetical protein
MTARSRSGLAVPLGGAKWPTERSASALSGTEASERISDRWLVAERTVRPARCCTTRRPNARGAETRELLRS